MTTAQRKPAGAAAPCGPRAARWALLGVALSPLAPLVACNVRGVPGTVSVHTLEVAPSVQPASTRRAIVSDCAPLREMYSPLGQRLGLIQVRSEAEWQRLQGVAAGLGPCPDLREGMVVGVASRAGLPLNGDWPVRLEEVRVHHGAGLMFGSFEPGSYLPDGTTYVEVAFVPGLRAVLIVDLNGVRFYPH